ncbi:MULTISPECIES: SIS domain-containing protein [Rahnella]|uniref:SIS domain-containing protein n=1 Tax=Rahnella TaxID=34037 RepID=UPI001AD87B10|nr:MULTISPECIES: SIS domain-containing protein [Rahnella]MDF1896753.1 SIS domain-containing protein [Rahnella contaminans]
MSDFFREPESESALATGAKIRMSLSSLNNKERSIADWLLVKGNLPEGISIREVATTLGVSEPMVVKVAKKLGYSGFRELRSALLAYFDVLPFEREEEISEHDNLSVVMDKVFSNSIQALKEAQTVADVNVINQAAHLLYEAHRVVLLGVGGSSSVCHDFEHKLLRIGIHSHTYSDFHLMLMVACQLGEGDVMVVISQSGDTRELLNAVEIARKRGVRIICITNDNRSPLSQLSDLSIFSPARSGPLLGQNAVARVIQLNLLDTLFIALLLQDYQQLSANLQRGISIVEPLHSKNKF